MNYRGSKIDPLGLKNRKIYIFVIYLGGEEEVGIISLKPKRLLFYKFSLDEITSDSVTTVLSLGFSLMNITVLRNSQR